MYRLALVFAALLAACVDAAPPLVSDFNGHTVKLVYHPYPLGADYKGSPLYSTAVETCGSDAVYQGMRQVSQYQGEHIFLCRP